MFLALSGCHIACTSWVGPCFVHNCQPFVDVKQYFCRTSCVRLWIAPGERHANSSENFFYGFNSVHLNVGPFLVQQLLCTILLLQRLLVYYYTCKYGFRCSRLHKVFFFFLMWLCTRFYFVFTKCCCLCSFFTQCKVALTAPLKCALARTCPRCILYTYPCCTVSAPYCCTPCTTISWLIVSDPFYISILDVQQGEQGSWFQIEVAIALSFLIE